MLFGQNRQKAVFIQNPEIPKTPQKSDFIEI